MELKFYSLKDKTPEIKERVLIRCALNEYELGTWEYDQHTKQYGVYVPDDLDMGVLNYVYEKDIVGWMPVSDLDKIEPLLWGGSGLSILEPRSAREAALEWLNGKWYRFDIEVMYIIYHIYIL